MTKLRREDCLAAMQKGEFEADVVGAAPGVAVVLTQSWCPQWTWMKAYLEELPESPERAIFWIEYDNEDYYEAFMAFKEETFGNREIPYVRYYRRGQFIRESNFIDEKGFLRLLERVPAL
jgi:hypothetical protein